MLWPKKISFNDIGINALGSLISWLVGSIIIVVIVFFVTGMIDLKLEYQQSIDGWMKTSAMFPIILSVLTFIGTSVTMFLTYKLLTLTSPERYKKNGFVLWQIAFFWVLTYILITPIYIYMGLVSYENLITIFFVHTIILAFGTSVILELLNNYKYSLIWLYGSFIWLYFSIIITLILFSESRDCRIEG